MNPRKESQQREVNMTKEDKNRNGKRTTETKLTRRKARKLSKKRAKFEKLQKVPERTSLTENLQIGSFAGIIEQRHMALRHGEAIKLLGPIYPFDCCSERVRKHLLLNNRLLDHAIMDRTRVNEASYPLQTNHCQVAYLSHRTMHGEHFC
jgi:hypothetical protein